MKIRNGFVSNSSSSSFMIIGAKVNFTQKEQDKYYEEDEIPSRFKGLDCLDVDGDGFYVGKLIFDISSNDGEEIKTGDISIEDIEEISKKMPKEYKKIKIYYGTRAC